MKQSNRSRVAILFLLLGGTSIAACAQKEKAEPSPSAVSSTGEALVTADPGKLKTIMDQLGVDMIQLQSGLWIEDFDLIASSAMAIAEHPKVDDQEKRRVMTTMGEEMGAFVAMDKAVHGTALAIAEAARKKEMPLVLQELGKLQSSCVTCHSIFRGRLTK